MTYQEFEQSFFAELMKNPHYRLGQHFINLCVKDPSTPEMCRLWNEKSIDKARLSIYHLIRQYNWCMDDLPILSKGSLQ
ncbi:hypothetical protein VPHG_00087 [Vibrio phage 11895-B1]|uniref:hypothetical protein n=1 Tax=Vibrio phage 11895-B1 TaxID=754075 RepID=UPI0002C0FACD|nr:hypothetical protein VPHG_00087 [Vibrio phage 11895-B1]AGH32154.1 hypothetical protein VPHG_00087 [Vibrio phage 11895-B1]